MQTMSSAQDGPGNALMSLGDLLVVKPPARLQLFLKPAHAVPVYPQVTLHQLGVCAVARDKFVVRAPLDDMTVVEHDDLVAITDRGQSMSHHDAGYLAPTNRLDYLLLGLGVKRARCLVENRDGGLLCEHARDFQALELATGKAFFLGVQIRLGMCNNTYVSCS